MKIELVKEYGVIESLTATELPSFAVLIGPNGAGKSHVLRALVDGSLTIPGIPKEGIVHYETNAFQSHSSQRANRQSSESSRRLVDTFFFNRGKGVTLVDLSRKIFDEIVGSLGDPETQETFVASLKEETQNIPRRGVFGRDRNNSYREEIREKVLASIANRERELRISTGERRLSDLAIKDSQDCQLLSAAMRRAGRLPHELTPTDVHEALYYDDNLLSNRLSEVFSRYKLGQYTWAHKQIQTSRGMSYCDLMQKYQEDSKPPWRIMREVLAEMRDAAGDYALFNFDFTDPEDQELNMDNYEFYTFTADMTNRTTGATYDLGNLSSGEKVLMALCMVSFNQFVGRRPPQLLLLDEVDAVLHPSMVKALVRTLKTIFVSKGTPVLMTSHSPMAVAILDDKEVFRVNRNGGKVEISPIAKSDAISELSEGLATADMGLRIAEHEGSKITILTEGHNTKHLKKWVEVQEYNPNDVRIFEGIEDRSGCQQLVTYGRLLAKMKLNTHFVIVFDCDAEPSASSLRRSLSRDSDITPFAFKHRMENQIARKGIENNYEDSKLEPYTNKTTGPDGKLLRYELDARQKSRFAKEIWENGTRADFIYFQGLNDVVDRILRDMKNQTAGLAETGNKSVNP